MSESKAKLLQEVQRLSGVCREASDLIERTSEIVEAVQPNELQRLLRPLREAIRAEEAA